MSANLVEFDDVGMSALDSATAGVVSEPPVNAVAQVRPVSGDAEAASLDALRAQANTDRPAVDRDHCYAKLVSATHPEEGSTLLQR
ncbi:hypothetical protein [Gordonia amicalis]|uniref:hypothetical protein n=1 Tax=Gordonia amicalis TaxID=89053 RepID=UPI0029536299|nr:hypothetical protein [Gordonia amicalis]MDV7075844.1 hypothetical protein [Gordonia amicalis]